MVLKLKRGLNIKWSFVLAAALVFVFILFSFSQSAISGEEPEDILSEMSLEEKIGQLLMVNILKDSDGSPSQSTEEIIKDLNIGSVIIYDLTNLRRGTNFINQLQSWAEKSSAGLPLLVGSDLEYGLSTNVENGVTTFPQQMGITPTTR